MIKFGRLTNPGEDIIKEINKTKKLGFNYVEVGIEAPTESTVLRKKISSISKSLKKFSCQPIGHTSWWYDLSSPYEKVRKAWIYQAKTDIKIASEFGVKLLNMHFYIPSGILLKNKNSGNKILNNFVRSLDELSNFADKPGITLIIENLLEKFEYYKYVLDRVDKIKVHFDVGHAFISGGMPVIKNFISQFEDRIAHIHVHDNHGKQDEHLALGKGKINWKKVVSMLKKSGYDKTITFEVFKSDKDLVKSREYFKKLWFNVK